MKSSHDIKPALLHWEIKKDAFYTIFYQLEEEEEEKKDLDFYVWK